MDGSRQIPRRPVGAPVRQASQEQLPAEWANDLTQRFRRTLSTRRLNHLSNMSRYNSTPAPIDYSSPVPPPLQQYQRANAPPSYSSLRNIPLIPTPPRDARSLRFKNMLHSLSNMPCKWENPGLLDEALRVVPLERIYAEAEEEANVFAAEAASLGNGKKPAWDYSDCVVRALLSWFKKSFFTWVNNPPCSKCGMPTTGVGMAAVLPDEQARGANQVELYKCALEDCGAFERFPRYNDAFVLLQTRKGRVGEWANCFGMLCRAVGSRVRWVWNSEDHVWIEVYSTYRKKWIHVDPCEEQWDKPTLYTQGWNKKLAYCIAFSADGAMDVTRRYVRNPAKHGKERARAPESVLLHILDEIRALRRQNLSKQEKFKLQGEDMKEDEELRQCIIKSIAFEICRLVPGQTDAAGGRTDADAQKAAEARAAAEAERQRQRRGGSQDQQPRRDQDQR